MATLTGIDQAERAFFRAVERAMKGPVKDFLMRDANNAIEMQLQPDGKPFPKKAESTKKAYRRMGWDTERFLHRTGESRRLTSAFTKRAGVFELTITPRGWETLSYHVPDRVQWFGMTLEMANRVQEIISDEVRRELS